MKKRTKLFIVCGAILIVCCTVSYNYQCYLKGSWASCFIDYEVLDKMLNEVSHEDDNEVDVNTSDEATTTTTTNQGTNQSANDGNKSSTIGAAYYIDATGAESEDDKTVITYSPIDPGTISAGSTPEFQEYPSSTELETANSAGIEEPPSVAGGVDHEDDHDYFITPNHDVIEFDEFGVGKSTDNRGVFSCRYWKDDSGRIYEITDPSFNMDEIRQSPNWHTYGRFVGTDN